MRPVVQLALVVAGAVETFDQDGFTASLASLAGAPPEAITLAVSAGSVHVLATIAGAPPYIPLHTPS